MEEIVIEVTTEDVEWMTERVRVLTAARLASLGQGARLCQQEPVRARLVEPVAGWPSVQAARDGERRAHRMQLEAEDAAMRARVAREREAMARGEPTLRASIFDIAKAKAAR